MFIELFNHAVSEKKIVFSRGSGPTSVETKNYLETLFRSAEEACDL